MINDETFQIKVLGHQNMTAQFEEIRELQLKIQEGNSELFDRMISLAKQEGFMKDGIWNATEFVVIEFDDHYKWCDDTMCAEFLKPENET